MHLNLRFGFGFLWVLLMASPLFADPLRNPPIRDCDPTKDKECMCDSGITKITNGCVQITLDLGRTSRMSGARQVSLKLLEMAATPEIFTPAHLNLVLGYTFKYVGSDRTKRNVPQEVVFADSNGEAMTFRFAEGSSLAACTAQSSMNQLERLQMVDAEGWATVEDPAYYDLYPGDGTVWRFYATDVTGRLGELVSHTDARGKVTTLADFGVEVVRGSYGQIRQVLAPSRLADVTVEREDKYVVSVYPIVGRPEMEEGLYVVPQTAPVYVLSIEREAGDNHRLLARLKKGTGAFRDYRYRYHPDVFDWELTFPNGNVSDKAIMHGENDDATLESIQRTEDGTLLTWQKSYFEDFGWGLVKTRKKEGREEGPQRVTTWDYVMDGANRGRVASTTDWRGNQTDYEYDGRGRVIRESLLVVGRETVFSYAPVDQADVLNGGAGVTAVVNDTRPRCEVRYEKDPETEAMVEVARTYFVYSPTQEIVERAATAGAAYAAAGALRTVRTWYAPDDARPFYAGRLASVRDEDGSLRVYDYRVEDERWVETVTALHEQAPEPVSGKTTRSLVVYDRVGNVVERNQEAFIDGAWRLIDRIVYEYDIEGHVIKETDFAGRVTTTVWGGSCCGKTSMTLPNGVRYTYAYDAEGRLVAETKLDPLPCTAHTEYDALGRVVKTWRDGLNPETTTYDLFGQIASRTDVRGGVTTYAYSADGRTVTTTLPNGGTQVNVTDVFGRLVSVSGTAAIPQTIAYGPLRTRVSSGARWQKEERNLLGQVVRETRPGANGSTLETLTTYDAYGRPAQIISTGAPAQTFVYAPTGARTALTQTVGNETRRLCTKSRYFVEEGKVWHERAFRDETSAATVPPQTWGWRWQCTGLTQTNAFTIVAQDSRGNAFRYHGNDAEARLRLPWCSNERIWRFAGGALVEAVDSACVTNRVTRDALGRVVAHTDGRGNTTRFVYSAGNLLEKQCDAMGVETGYGYDVMGNLTAITNGLGYVTVFEYDVRGNRTYEGGATYPVRYVYDEHGAIVAMTTYRDEASGQGDTTRWEYDAATGSLLKEIAPDGATIQYAYMDTGATKTRIDARGITTHYAYDGWGNLLSKTYSDGTPSVVYTRDARGRPLTIQDARGLSRWNWTDKYERDDRSTDYVVSAAVPYYPYSLVYYMKLDAYGRRLNHSMTLGRGNTNCHDPATGRVIAVGDVSASRHDIAYLPNTHQQASRAVGDGNDRLTTIWTYEAKRDLPVAIQNAGFSDYAYRYDALGRCVERTITRHPLPDRNEVATAQTTVERFRYNWRDELIAENDITYTYDDCGNRKAAGGRTYQTNARNQYTAITNPADTTTPTFTPTYDADGNQTRVLTQTGIWEVAYDAENRPTRFTQGAKTISFLYDYLGRCVARAASLNGTTNWNAYVYCGRYCITHHDSRKINGNAYDRHIQWDYSEDCRSARPLGAWDITNGRDLHYFYDGQGNLSDIALGTIGPPPVLRYTYSAFGEWTSTFHNRDAIEIREGEHERALRTCPFGFSGEMRDDDLGLVRYLRRWYNPRDARWITPDPAPESRYRPNRYLFVRNNPLNLRDAFGEKPYKPFTFPNDVNIVQRGGLPGQDTLALAVISYFYLNDGIPVSPLSFNSEDILSLDSAVKQDCCEGSLRGVNYTIKPFAAHVTIAISPNVWDKRDLPPSQTGLTRVHTIVEHEQIHITNAKTEFDQATKLLQNALGDCEPEACDASRRAYVELGLKELRLNRQLQDFQLHFEDYLEENAPPQSQKEDLETELNEIRTQKEKVHMEHGTCILNQPK